MYEYRFITVKRFVLKKKKKNRKVVDPTKKMFIWSGVLTKHNLYMLTRILLCKHQIRKHLFDALVFVLGLVFPSLSNAIRVGSRVRRGQIIGVPPHQRKLPCPIVTPQDPMEPHHVT